MSISYPQKNMLEIIINNLDKVGLILNIIGTLSVLCAFGDLKDDPTRMSTGNGKSYKFSYLLNRDSFRLGIYFLIAGFILQFIS